MKAININRGADIEAALLAVNGKATAHTYTSANEIQALAVLAELRLDKLGIPKKARAGAAFHAVSGESVPNAYAKKARTRIATAVQLQRRPSGWFLTSVAGDTIWQTGGGTSLTVTKEQELIALAQFRTQYRVAA